MPQFVSNISTMETFQPILFILFSSRVFSKFLFDDTYLKSVNICNKAYQSTKKEIEHFMVNVSVDFSKDFNQKELCFLECIYRTNGLIDSFGSIQEKGLVPVIQKLIFIHPTPSISPQNFSSNIMVLCNQNSGDVDRSQNYFQLGTEGYTQTRGRFRRSLAERSIDSREPCIKAVERVECVEALVLLHTLGFLNNSITNLVLETTNLIRMMKNEILKFQKIFGLDKTGVLDYETLATIYSAGHIEDVMKPRRRRFVLYRNKWKNRNISYEISKYSETLPREIVDKEISRAFQHWSSILPLNVTFVPTGQGDIDIRFEKYDHGDVPFDGPGSILAHTFYPITFLNGAQKSFIHFDDQENWTVNSTKGVDFFQTALHEIGHALGLKHSNVSNSVMWPGHITYTPNFTLGEDDIRGIQTLYGIKGKQNEISS